jgi:hypothetical protein
MEKNNAIGIKLLRSTKRIHPDNKTYYKYAYWKTAMEALPPGFPHSSYAVGNRGD